MLKNGRLIILLAVATLVVYDWLHPQLYGQSAEPGARKAYDFRLAPDYIALLKKQAETRKEFYENQSKTKNTLKVKHWRERQELLRTHREAREAFAKEKHTADERATFYSGQRKEMQELLARHKAEQKELAVEHKAKLFEFDKGLKNERDELAAKLKKN